jgi:dynein heavy chain
MEIIEDFIVKIQAMKGSAYVGPFSERIKSTEEKLVAGQRLFEEWMSFQSLWMYLEPIFASEDIMQQLPSDGRRFSLETTSSDTS